MKVPLKILVTLCKYISNKNIGAHRALPDVLGLEEVLTHPSLISCLSQLDIRHPSMQLRQWVQHKRAHTRKMVLTKGLGKCITAAQATRLDTLGITLTDLKHVRDSTDKEGFLKSLKTKGVRSQVLREKLQQAVLSLP